MALVLQWLLSCHDLSDGPDTEHGSFDINLHSLYEYVDLEIRGNGAGDVPDLKYGKLCAHSSVEVSREIYRGTVDVVVNSSKFLDRSIDHILDTGLIRNVHFDH